MQQLVVFSLGSEEYGLPITQVQEIIRYSRPRTIPSAPMSVRGVINLRGKIIPVLDLRLRFGFPAAASTEHSCIIVVQVTLPAGHNTQMGLVVDGVEEVTNIAAPDIEAAPDFGAQISTAYITGMAKLKDTVKTLLDIDRVLTGEVIPPIG